MEHLHLLVRSHNANDIDRANIKARGCDARVDLGQRTAALVRKYPYALLRIVLVAAVVYIRFATTLNSPRTNGDPTMKTLFASVAAITLAAASAQAALPNIQ